MHFDGFLQLKMDDQIFKIAVEYQGEQHYHFPNMFHRNTHKGRSIFLRAQLRDNFKRWLDLEKDIILIEFPYYVDEAMSHPKRIRDFIISNLKNKLNINLIFGTIPEFNHITQSKL